MQHFAVSKQARPSLKGLRFPTFSGIDLFKRRWDHAAHADFGISLSLVLDDIQKIIVRDNMCRLFGRD